MTALAKVPRAIDYTHAGPSIIPGFAGSSPRESSMTVTVENLVKEFGQTPALHGVSLDIAGGELIALLGPSGSGKTTLLRLIAGLDFPTAGRVLFGHEDASSKSVQDRNVGFVFQSYALFRHMTVFENVAFPLREHTRLPEALIRDLVLLKLQAVGLRGAARHIRVPAARFQHHRIAAGVADQRQRHRYAQRDAHGVRAGGFIHLLQLLGQFLGRQVIQARGGDELISEAVDNE